MLDDYDRPPGEGAEASVDFDELVGICAHQLADAAAGPETQVTAAATGLATELSDLTAERAQALLAGAAAQAVELLDSSELDAAAFAPALKRLSELKRLTGEALSLTAAGR